MREAMLALLAKGTNLGRATCHTPSLRRPLPRRRSSVRLPPVMSPWPSRPSDRYDRRSAGSVSRRFSTL